MPERICIRCAARDLCFISSTKSQGSRPIRSSGASALVNFALSVNPARHSHIERPATAKELRDNSRRKKRYEANRNEANTNAINMILCPGNTFRATSGSPACFWPVWFQTRTSRKTPSKAIVHRRLDRPCPLSRFRLDMSTNILDAKGKAGLTT